MKYWVTFCINRKLYISFISQLELLGYTDITFQERNEIRTFLDDCIIIDINTQIKEEVIKIRQSARIKLPYSIILATSQYLNVPVISSDSDFGRVEEANVIYYTPRPFPISSILSPQSLSVTSFSRSTFSAR